MTNKILTYSLLAHIRNKASFIEGPIDIFVPLIKKTLSSLNSEGVFKGESIDEIRAKALTLFGIDFPIPVLVKILGKISLSVNTEEQTYFQIYVDGSFEIRDYTFQDYDEIVSNLSAELAELESFFSHFRAQHDKKGKFDFSSVTEFIDQNKNTISKYLGNENKSAKGDNSFAVRFIVFIKNIPALYELIKRIYLGSLLSNYIEFKADDVRSDVELLLDTNFIIGLLDLNTKESTHTCKKLMEIAVKRKMKLTVLSDTLIETERLIRGKAESLKKSYLVSKINSEDIYNACERRSLGRSDLERIADNLKRSLQEYGVTIIFEPKKYRNLAKFSDEYKRLKIVRGSEFSALHDATAIYYVRDKRGKKIKKFEDVNCWFLNNTSNLTRYTGNGNRNKFQYQPESVKVDDLLNLLWLSNPEVDSSLSTSDLTDIGLNSMLSLAINRSLPSTKVISELEDNILKYGKESISDSDVVLLSQRISQSQIKDISSLNKIAKADPSEFISQVQLEAKKQKDYEQNLYNKLSSEIKRLSQKADEINTDIENNNVIKDQNKILVTRNSNLLSKLLDEKNRSKHLANSIRTTKRNKFIYRKVFRWRATPYFFIIGSLLFVLIVVQYHYHGNDLSFPDTLRQIYQSDDYFNSKCLCGFALILLNLFGFKMLYDRVFDNTKIGHYKSTITIPEDLKELE